MFTYCNLIQDNSGEGNIVNQDPQWVDPENGDYRLKLSSPCIDSGSTTGPATDLDGNPRPVDVLGVGRDGPGAYDMGCYEFQLPKGDLNSDGLINAHDHLMMFGERHPDEPADFSGYAVEDGVASIGERLTHTYVGRRLILSLMERNAERELRSGVTTARQVGCASTASAGNSWSIRPRPWGWSSSPHRPFPTPTSPCSMTCWISYGIVG